MAEHSAVNRRVVGSSPTWGATGLDILAISSPFFVGNKVPYSRLTAAFEIGYLNEMKNMSGTTFGIRWNNSFQLPAGYIFRLNGEYTGKGVYQNCYTRPVSCLSTSIYKSFFNGRVDCLLEGNDLFHSMRDANTQYDDLVKMFRETKRNTQEVKLTVHYKFNLQKSKYKGTGAGLGEQQRL